MNKLFNITVTTALLVAMAVPSSALAQRRGSYGSHRGRPPAVRHYGTGHGYGRSSHGWSAAGHVLAGMAIGSLFTHASYASEPRREVVYSTRTVYQEPVVIQRQVVVPQTTTVVVPAVTESVWVRNSNDSQTLVELRRAGNGRYIGPKGEYYESFPSNEQLRQIYGF